MQMNTCTVSQNVLEFLFSKREKRSLYIQNIKEGFWKESKEEKNIKSLGSVNKILVMPCTQQSFHSLVGNRFTKKNKKL